MRPIASLAAVRSASPTNTSPKILWLKPPVVWITAPLLIMMTAYCWHLWPEWRRNPDLSHGFFTPFISVMLILESRREGTRRWLPPGRGWTLLPTLAIGAAVCLFALTGLLAASVGWDHVLVDFLLSVTLASALLGGIFCLSTARLAVVPLNWISLTAAGIWILSAPLPSGTYTRLTMGLQSWVSSGVINSLQLLGIPARQHGNIIELTRTTVGVEEACSGIRSLLSCVYASIFFAAWQVRSLGGRALLLVVAPALALGMNFVRSLSLTLMANAGMEISGFWHDATGFAILGLTAGILALLALKLSPGGSPAPAPDMASDVRAGGARESDAHVSQPQQADDTEISHPAFRGFGVGVLALALLAAVFAFYGRSVPPAGTPAADPALLLPATAEGWEVSTAGDIYKFAGILRTNQLVERTYSKTVAGQPFQISVYVAYWAPGQAPVSLVASHTPDACWPGAGWTPRPDVAPHPTLMLAGRTLPPAEYRIFQSGASTPYHVWFWHVYDGRVINYRDPYSVPALLELALRYGFRREGGQYFVRITSNQPWEQLAREPLVAEIITNLTHVGLTP